MINHQCLCSTVDSGFAFKDFLRRELVTRLWILTGE